METYKRDIFQQLMSRLAEPRRFIQVLAGPRQVGKTTLTQQILPLFPGRAHYVSADELTLDAPTWLLQQWDVARQMAATNTQDTVLIVDEIQRIADWSRLVKLLWDEDSRRGITLKVVILGSAPLLLQQGLTESLAGRFEVIHATHWSFHEMREAFDWDLPHYIYFGGYPGAVDFINDIDRWARYVKESLIEPTLAHDILLMVCIDKPALLRRLFQVGCHYSGKILSYQKMLGQLQDAGNTTTLSHYLRLLNQVNMLCGLEKYAGQEVRKRGSSPKFQVYNNTLLSVQNNYSFSEVTQNPAYWRQWVESAVGAYLVNQAIGKSIQVYYWREGNAEVDFVLQKGDKVVALDVKSNVTEKISAMTTFNQAFKPYKLLQIGGQGMPLEIFFTTTIEDLFL